MAKRRVGRYSNEFRRACVERMKQCDDISALSRELDIDRRLLYRWRDQLDPPDKSEWPPPQNSREATGVDYETRAGTFSFETGSTQINIPVKICGDTSAEANETFRVILSNVSGAALLPSPQGLGTIVNDDVLGLILEESGPSPAQAAALDQLLGLRDPFRIVTIPDWFATGPDRNTRVVLFARNLQLNPGEAASAVVVRLQSSTFQLFDLPAQDVRPIPGTEFTQVIIRLPDNVSPGTCTLNIRAHTRISNIGTFRIAP